VATAAHNVFNSNILLVGPSRRTRNANRCYGCLHILHNMDTFHGTWSTASLSIQSLTPTQPFVDEDHPLQSLFPPRVWAIRIPVVLILLGSAVVGSFLGVVMIQSNKKKAAKMKKKA